MQRCWRVFSQQSEPESGSGVEPPIFPVAESAGDAPVGPDVDLDWGTIGGNGWWGSAALPPVGLEAIIRAHRKPRRPPVDYKSRKQKAADAVLGEIDALAPLIPSSR